MAARGSPGGRLPGTREASAARVMRARFYVPHRRVDVRHLKNGDARPPRDKHHRPWARDPDSTSRKRKRPGSEVAHLSKDVDELKRTAG